MKGERVKVSESHTLAKESGIKAAAWRGEGGLHSERREFQGGEGGQVRICRFLISFLVWLNLKWEKRLADEEPAY